jgi:hypothetical protein
VAKNKTEIVIDVDEFFKRLDKHYKQLETMNQQIIDRAFKAGYECRKQEVKNYFKQTERRLYDYPELKENIEKYKLDIEDLKKEKWSVRSKDIVRMPEGSGNRLTPDEKQQVKIMSVEIKSDRDTTEITEIEYALNAVKHDEYYMVIEYKYFDKMNDIDIATIMCCDDSTVRRHKSRLVHRIALKLYGADVQG